MDAIRHETTEKKEQAPMGIVEELAKKQAGHQKAAWLKYRKLLRDGGDADQLDALTKQLGLGLETVQLHARAIAIHGKQSHQLAELESQVAELEQLDRELLKLKEDFVADLKRRRAKYHQARQEIYPRFESLQPRRPELETTTRMVEALERVFPVLFAEEPGEGADPSTLPAEVTNHLRGLGILPASARGRPT